MVCDLEVFDALDEELDRLLLGEEAEGVAWVTFRVPPATFFWPTVTLADVVDGDCGWLFVLKVEVRTPVVEGVTDCPRLWVVVTKLREIRHDANSVMMIEMAAIRMTIMSPSSHDCFSV